MRRSRPFALALACLGIAWIGPTATELRAQNVTYSIDWEGPTIGTPDGFFGVPITEGDILAIAPAPGIVISGGVAPPPPPGLNLPAHPAAVGHPPGIPGFVEVDAISYGMDELVSVGRAPELQWAFSVDEFAMGLQPPPPRAPCLSTEGIMGSTEASADIYVYFPRALPPGPVGPFAAPPGDTQRFDGDGVAPGIPLFLALVEPNPPAPGPLVLGDNVDALDIDTFVPVGYPGPVYFSLEGTIFDPIEMFPGSGSALANGGFSGADVWVTIAPGAPPFIFVPGPMIGLDLQGPDTDDLDALIFRENGDGVFIPPQQPYDWVTGNADMIFYSVRRGSAIIGTFDSLQGLPIEEGDILVPNGPPGSPPGIWIAAETLGLFTMRSGFPPGPFPFGDDLDGMDVFQQQFIRSDCNGTGLTDLADPVFLLQFLFGLGPAPDCDDACDADDDGLLNITDPIYILNFLFAAGPAPPPPFPNCGVDPTTDNVTCAIFMPCP